MADRVELASLAERCEAATAIEECANWLRTQIAHPTASGWASAMEAEVKQKFGLPNATDRLLSALRSQTVEDSRG